MAHGAAGRLYVVATPIGNLGDLSERARATLRSCALIASEDTRHTGSLLKHFGIATPQLSLHQHNEAVRSQEIVRRLQAGQSVALVSDAGTPAISDPGFELVNAAAAAGIEIVAVPGPCAAIAALSIGALPTDKFCFEGFLPARRAARRERLSVLRGEPRTLVFYESPHRIAAMLEDCRDACGELRRATLVREATKMHESTYRGTLEELAAQAAAGAFFKGEIVVLIAGAPATPGESEAGVSLDRVLTELLKELPLKQAARLAAQITGARDNEVYRRALHLKNETASQ